MEEVKRIELTCIAVGQGLGNLAEYYNEKDELVFLALFDFGCFYENDDTKARTSDGLAYVQCKMEERCIVKQNKLGLLLTGGLFLDLAVISHQDMDHWLLLNKLLKETGKPYEYLYKEISQAENYIKWNHINGELDETYEGRAPKSTALGNTVVGDMNYCTESLSMKGHREVVYDSTNKIYKENGRFEMHVDASQRNCTEIAAVSKSIRILELNESTIDSARRFFYLHIIASGQLLVDKANKKVCLTRSVTFKNQSGQYCTYQEELKCELPDEGDNSDWTVSGIDVRKIINFEPRFMMPGLVQDMVDPNVIDLDQFIINAPENYPEGKVLIRMAVTGGSILFRSKEFMEFSERLQDVSITHWDRGKEFRTLIPSPLINIRFYILCNLQGSPGIGRIEGIRDTNDVAIHRNYSSAVILMVIRGNSQEGGYDYGIFFPGDATSHTMNYLSLLARKDSGKEDLTFWKLPRVYVENILAFVPHHGSAHTNQGYHIPPVDPPADPDPFMIFKSFRDLLAARRSQVSSGMDNFNEQFHHPDKSVMELINESAYLLDENPEAPVQGRHSLRVWNSEEELEKFTTVKANNGTMCSAFSEGEAELGIFHHRYTIICQDDNITVEHAMLEALVQG